MAEEHQLSQQSSWMKKYYPGCFRIDIIHDAGEWGIFPVRVDGYAKQYVLEELIDPDELVIKDDTITIKFC